MRTNTITKDYKTLAYVLKRTNYSEADRILNLITPSGKVAAIAKGVRKEKSKLAGGIEIFSLIELNLHVGKSEFAIVTSSRMIKYYGNILKDYNRMELAGIVLKKINHLAEHSDNPDYYKITDQCLVELNNDTSLELIRNWFAFNVLKASGEEVNLYRDTNGEKLSAGDFYDWDVGQSAFSRSQTGIYGANEIKMMRLMSTASLATVKKVKSYDALMNKITDFIRIVGEA
ncbi:DNA repair protein RecO [Candidatus Saccharibacteria bacterium]|nr:DNA repair protein RecO [Candidatus Saccharibacteria bacterium]